MKAKLSNFIALDLGSSKIASIAAYVDKKGDIKVLNQNLHYAEGFRSGEITDLKAAEESIVGAIYTIERNCEKNIKQVAVSLSGAHTKSNYMDYKVKLSGAPITKNDVTKLVHKALSEFKLKDEEVIHCFPIAFSIDDRNIVDNPVGIVGKELACKLHIVTVASHLIQNLVNCLDKCQLDISEIVLSVYASGTGCLSDDEKNLGSIIIDLGARTTSFGVFLSNKLAYTGYIPIGSAHITSDIAKVFSISFEAAEKLKLLYGNAFLSGFDKDNPINLDDIETDNAYNLSMTITSNQLSSVIAARVEEIMMLVKEKYDSMNVDHLISRRVVITGGGAMLRGVKEVAGKIFEKQVRIGKPSILSGFAEDYNPGAYSTVVGMVKNHSLKQQKLSIEVDSASENSTWLSKALTWLKENI